MFSPRRSNLDDLAALPCRGVEYLPFAYNPEVHFQEESASAEETALYQCDVAFIGGADADRLTTAAALIGCGFKVHLYGGYWERHRKFRAQAKGAVYGRALRLAVAGAAVHVCIGRKANRDGHAMRSLELPAMGACIVAEDTAEHRALYGEPGECVEYFRDEEELISAVAKLCADPGRRSLFAERVRARSQDGNAHTYAARWRTITARGLFGS